MFMFLLYIYILISTSLFQCDTFKWTGNKFSDHGFLYSQEGEW